MKSTFPTIVKFTPAVLAAVCERHGQTPDQFRLNTLKRVECELDNLINNAIEPLRAEDHDALTDLHRQVRLAIGDE